MQLDTKCILGGPRFQPNIITGRKQARAQKPWPFQIPGNGQKRRPQPWKNRPIGAKLEFHGQSGGDPYRDIAQEQLAPESNMAFDAPQTTPRIDEQRFRAEWLRTQDQINHWSIWPGSDQSEPPAGVE
jgi:hypothetical protein